MVCSDDYNRTRITLLTNFVRQNMNTESLIGAIYNNEIISSKAISQLLGYSDRWLYTRLSRQSNWLDSLVRLGFSGEMIELSIGRKVGRGGSQIKTLKDKDFQILLSYEACLGNPNAAQALTGNKVKTRKVFKKSDEKKIQLKLAHQLNAKVEVPTAMGNIDILTDAEIIEVKCWCSWKCALGQILAYGYFYPEHQKRIHCYGKFPENSATIKDFLNMYGVELTWEL